MDFKRWLALETRIDSLVENIIAEDRGEGFMSWFRRKHPIKPKSNKDCKADIRKAIQTLRDSLKGPEFEALLDDLESKLKDHDDGEMPEVDVDFGFDPDFSNLTHGV